MLRPRLPRSIAATSLVLALATPARAQSVEAETLFRDGERLMAAGQLDDACAAFAASNRLEARAGTLINLGMCEEKRQRLASAWIAYREALTRVKDPAKKTFATERATALEPKLSTIAVVLPQGGAPAQLAITRDGKPLDPALYGRAVPVDGGPHTIEVRAPGYAPWVRVVDVAVAGEHALVDVPPLVRSEPSPPPPPPPRAQVATSSGGNRGVALVIGGLGVAALGVGIWAGLSARGLDADAHDVCPDLDTACPDAPAANALLDRRDTRALVANLGFGVAAAGAIAVTVLLVTGGSSSRAADVAIVPRGDGALVAWRAAF